MPMHSHMGGGTNSGYNGMPTSLGIVLMLIRCLEQGSMAEDKPYTVHPNILAHQKLTLQTAPLVLHRYLTGTLFFIPTYLYGDTSNTSTVV